MTLVRQLLPSKIIISIHYNVHSLGMSCQNLKDELLCQSAGVISALSGKRH